MLNCCSVIKTVPLSDFAQSYLSDYESTINQHSADTTIGSILSNVKYAWFANGPRFQVVQLNSGKTIAAWTFGSVVKDSTTKVVCVTEIPTFSRDLPLLIIGLDCALSGGTICVFDISTSRILRAIQINDKITSVNIIDNGNNLLPLSGPLGSFDGIVGVGTVGGDVLLMDLCLQLIQEGEVKDEVDACEVLVLTSEDFDDLEYHKQRLQDGIHLGIYLNVDINDKSPHFSLKGPKGDIRLYVNKSEVTVSSLYYSPQLGSLFVGFNFGAWQIWKLQNINLIYTSPVYEENTPVSHFAIQEPADDPKPFCYVWVIYSNTEQFQCGFPISVLYSLSYNTKEYHDGYGHLYQDFRSCTVRYQSELSSTSENNDLKGANCLRLTVYNKIIHNKINQVELPAEVLSICLAVWNVWGPNGTETYLSLFDLNQWYKTQMPTSPDGSCESYVSFVCVSELMDRSDCPVLDVNVDEFSLKQFLGIQKPEEHYYPTALSYEFYVCNEKNTTVIHNEGKQRNLLKNLEKSEVFVLIKPTEICKRAFELGLTPLFFDVPNDSVTNQRYFLLNLALEHQMISWIRTCANVWSNGSCMSSGCTLDFLLRWAWDRAHVLKSNADALCVPLFDFSGTSTDMNALKILNSCVSQLKSVYLLYDYVCGKLIDSVSDVDMVKQQCNSLQMITTYLDVVQWLVNTGMLPENSNTFPYPVRELSEYYNKRRCELELAYKRRFSSNEPLLFIDGLLRNEFTGNSLQEYWKKDCGDGFYPPPSIQSLLRTYLINDVPLNVKHSVVIYTFLDLAMSLDKENHTFIITQLIKFPTIFQINASTLKVTQAFWHLDHCDFGLALEKLLDQQLLNTDLKVWHHRNVLNALLIQGQHNLALSYYQIRGSYVKEDDDILKILSLFVENSMIREAIDFQRLHSNPVNQLRFLTHVYGECNGTGQLKKILHCPLTALEEKSFMDYLKNISHPDEEEYEVIYYLERFRYMDIFKMTERDGKKFVPSGLVGRKNLPFKENITRTLTSLFPGVTRNLVETARAQMPQPRNRVVVTRPRPMSVFVHNTAEQAKYKSNLIQIGIEKSKETWNRAETDIDGIPFVTTPSTGDSRKRPNAVIHPKVIRGVDDADAVESPAKRIKLSAAVAATPANSSGKVSPSCFRFDTPIVPRKSYSFSTPGAAGENRLLVSQGTPHSILKGGSLRKSPARTSVRFSDINASTSQLKSQDFEDIHQDRLKVNEISSYVNEDISNINKDASIVNESVGNKDSSNSSASAEEIYYSPDENSDSSPEKSKSFSVKGRISYKDASPNKSFENNQSLISPSVTPGKLDLLSSTRIETLNKSTLITNKSTISTNTSVASKLQITKESTFTTQESILTTKESSLINDREKLSKRLIFENDERSTRSPQIKTPEVKSKLDAAELPQKEQIRQIPTIILTPGEPLNVTDQINVPSNPEIIRTNRLSARKSVRQTAEENKSQRLDETRSQRSEPTETNRPKSPEARSLRTLERNRSKSPKLNRSRTPESQTQSLLEPVKKSPKFTASTPRTPPSRRSSTRKSLSRMVLEHNAFVALRNRRSTKILKFDASTDENVDSDSNVAEEQIESDKTANSIADSTDDALPFSLIYSDTPSTSAIEDNSESEAKTEKSSAHLISQTAFGDHENVVDDMGDDKTSAEREETVEDCNGSDTDELLFSMVYSDTPNKTKMETDETAEAKIEEPRESEENLRLEEKPQEEISQRRESAETDEESSSSDSSTESSSETEINKEEENKNAVTDENVIEISDTESSDGDSDKTDSSEESSSSSDNSRSSPKFDYEPNEFYDRRSDNSDDSSKDVPVDENYIVDDQPQGNDDRPLECKGQENNDEQGQYENQEKYNITIPVEMPEESRGEVIIEEIADDDEKQNEQFDGNYDCGNEMNLGLAEEPQEQIDEFESNDIEEIDESVDHKLNLAVIDDFNDENEESNVVSNDILELSTDDEMNIAVINDTEDDNKETSVEDVETVELPPVKNEDIAVMDDAEHKNDESNLVVERNAVLSTELSIYNNVNVAEKDDDANKFEETPLGMSDEMNFGMVVETSEENVDDKEKDKQTDVSGEIVKHNFKDVFVKVTSSDVEACASKTDEIRKSSGEPINKSQDVIKEEKIKRDDGNESVTGDQFDSDKRISPKGTPSEENDQDDKQETVEDVNVKKTKSRWETPSAKKMKLVQGDDRAHERTLDAIEINRTEANEDDGRNEERTLNVTLRKNCNASVGETSEVDVSKTRRNFRVSSAEIDSSSSIGSGGISQSKDEQCKPTTSKILTPVRRSSRIASIDSDKSDKTNKSMSEAEETVKPSRRTRRVATLSDISEIAAPARRSKRSTSSSSLPAVVEERARAPARRSGRRKSGSVDQSLISDDSLDVSTRRLTRRQEQILKMKEEENERKARESSEPTSPSAGSEPSGPTLRTTRRKKMDDSNVDDGKGKTTKGGSDKIEKPKSSRKRTKSGSKSDSDNDSVVGSHRTRSSRSKTPETGIKSIKKRVLSPIPEKTEESVMPKRRGRSRKDASK